MTKKDYYRSTQTLVNLLIYNALKIVAYLGVSPRDPISPWYKNDFIEDNAF